MLSRLRRMGVDIAYRETYRAVLFMVEAPIANPTSPIHKETMMWNDLTPVLSECLQSCVSSQALRDQGEGLPCDSKSDQSREHPGWYAEAGESQLGYTQAWRRAWGRKC